MKTFFSLFIACMFNSMAQAQAPLVIAHRGASAYKPENTLSAFQYAFELGADAIELDVWITKDRKIVVNHDRDTKRVANENLVVPESTYAQLKELKLKEGESIPLLEEVLAIVPKGKKIFIEIKCCWEKGESGNIFPEAKKIIKKYRKQNDCLFIAFNPLALARAKKEFRRIPTFVLSGKPNYTQELKAIVKENHLTGIDVHFSTLTNELSQWIIDQKIPLYVWTVNQDADMEAMIANPLVKGITTDRPDALKKWIEQSR